MMKNVLPKIIEVKTIVGVKPVTLRVYDDMIGKIIVSGRMWESGFLKESLKYMRKGKKTVVFDCGANIGNHSIFWARFVKKVVSVEALPDTFGILKFNLEKNFNNAFAVHGVLSDKSGDNFRPEYNSGNMMGCYFEPDKDGPIKSITLNEIMVDGGDFVKIDVEGDEIKVLMGGDIVLPKFKPFLAIEIHRVGDREKLLDILKRYGYDPSDFVIKGHGSEKWRE
ncbi:MAG: FkbM family methyltransferase [Nitrospirae bacterium]|nr:FkbM family methyltransferase [Nitrospirota bacterium]